MPDNLHAMTPLLPENDTIDLFHHFENPVENLSVAVNWDSIYKLGRNFLGFKTKKISDHTDLGLTCVMFDRNNNMLDLVCSSKFNSWLIRNMFPLGKSTSKDLSVKHFDYGSTKDSLYKQSLSVDLQKISDETDHIYFYLSFDLRKMKSPDFSAVNSLRFTTFTGINHPSAITDQNIPTEKYCKKNEGIMILAKLYRENEFWKFSTVGKTISESGFIRFTKRVY